MNPKISPKTVLTNPLHLLAFGFGSGLMPKAPGTFGTLVGVPIFALLAGIALPAYLAVTVLITIVGIGLCHYSAKALGVHDHPGIVWDEIAGFLVTMTGFALTMENLVIGFLLFRFFDILKPWPIKWIDRRVGGGFGIMLDDIIAGLFAWLCLYGVHQIWL